MVEPKPLPFRSSELPFPPGSPIQSGKAQDAGNAGREASSRSAYKETRFD